MLLQLEDADELKERINAAAETIANGTQPRSQAEAMNQCVYISTLLIVF